MSYLSGLTAVEAADIKRLQQELEQASHTLHALPRSYLERPGRPQSAFPQPLQDNRHPAAGRTLKTGPTPEDIDRLMLILDALVGVSAMQRQLLWARALRLPWRHLQTHFSRSRAHLALLHQRALTDLAEQLVDNARRSAPQQIILLVHPADPAPLIQEMVTALAANFAPAQPQISIRRAETVAGMRHWQTRLLARLACQLLPETDRDHQRAARLLADSAASAQTAVEGRDK